VSRASRQGKERGVFTEVVWEGRSASIIGWEEAVACDWDGGVLVKVRVGSARTRLWGFVRRIRLVVSWRVEHSILRGADMAALAMFLVTATV